MRTRLVHRTQSGRTLIELLVAIALGLLILLGVGTLYMSSNQATRSATSVATIDNVGQVALTLIGNSIKRSGYSEIIGIVEGAGLSENVLYQGPTLRACTEGRFIGDDPTAGCVALGAGVTQFRPDSIAIWFQSDNVLASSQGITDDCIGNTPTQTTPVTNLMFQPRVANISVAQNVFHIDNGNLRCRGGAAAPQPLLTGVEDLKVFFGFDDFAFQNAAVLDTNRTARSVRDASFINALANPTPTTSAWDYVASVTVCVLVRTEERGVSTQGTLVPYTPCPQTADQASGAVAITAVTPPTTDPNAGAVRRAFTQTFSVRVRTRPSPLAG